MRAKQRLKAYFKHNGKVGDDVTTCNVKKHKVKYFKTAEKKNNKTKGGK